MIKDLKFIYILLLLPKFIFCMDFNTDNFINSLYIGEAFKPNEVYLEKFDLRNKKTYPKKLSFVGIKENKIYSIMFHKKVKEYIGNIKDSTKYFYKPFSKPIQDAGIYKINSNLINEMGIALSNYEIDYVDISNKGKYRKHSNKEYQKALNLIRNDRKIKEEDRSLNYITLDNTIIKAKEFFRIKLKNTNSEIRFSTYLTNGIEYAADVYVIDIYTNNKLVKTYEKFNLDGPY
ncbi:hypothetical protein CPU12_07360 [Malaciobacter molluscorum LMG 25693]|uniref:Uncharacterized protein n=1 Tax=Malaciobacter molluscorum LMG 25693 TaxID=870501 RepID=A0A2G1DIA7_9BACT|nr:hypothetical protein [Malaciobacter molluscorum]AXX93019.1 hypothetical protein AMOL_2065 [Malaciobacter molluscorum LMG 25693]PHO18076.1 hypothetical protein CPU12_07360 [Malaciobacter molluscorum LMG 25693]